jgi:hypothetical protein
VKNQTKPLKTALKASKRSARAPARRGAALKDIPTVDSTLLADPGAASTAALTPLGLIQLEPNIYVNEVGAYVDVSGVPLGYRLKVLRAQNLANTASDRDMRVFGRKARDVVEVLEAIALDNQSDDDMRCRAATAAAPYVRRKKPIGIDGGADGAPIGMAVTMQNLRGLSAKELLDLKALLVKAKVETEAQA